MEHIKFINLNDLLNDYPEQIEIIKVKYLFLLSELTLISNIETPIFKDKVINISKIGTIIVGYVGDPKENGFELVASGTLIIEPKIIRNGKNVGHIEDIVVSKFMRGKNISQKILNMLKEFAKNKNCYKVILDCNDNDIKKVYIKNGFSVKGIQMAEYFMD